MKLRIAAAMLTLCQAFATSAVADVAADYGSRDPANCPDRKAPASGAPSVAQATRYLACDMEGPGGGNHLLYLLADIKLQVASTGRKFNINTDSAHGIDPAKPVYDIRGGFRMYACKRRSEMLPSEDKTRSCSYQDYADLSGSCWLDTFAEWHCLLSYFPDFRKAVRGVAPPQ